MTEQIRKRVGLYKPRPPRHDNSQLEQPATGERRREAEEQLKRIDDVLSEYQAYQTPAVPSIVVGQTQAHQVVRPLSDEELVKNFRQTRGE